MFNVLYHDYFTVPIHRQFWQVATKLSTFKFTHSIELKNEQAKKGHFEILSVKKLRVNRAQDQQNAHKRPFYSTYLRL